MDPHTFMSYPSIAVEEFPSMGGGGGGGGLGVMFLIWRK
jgi:hypothetical protein